MESGMEVKDPKKGIIDLIMKKTAFILIPKVLTHFQVTQLYVVFSQRKQLSPTNRHASFSTPDAIPSADQVRITPSLRSQRGSVWTKNKVTFDHWEAEVTFRVSGRGRMGADGLVRRHRLQQWSEFKLHLLYKRLQVNTSLRRITCLILEFASSFPSWITEMGQKIFRIIINLKSC